MLAFICPSDSKVFELRAHIAAKSANTFFRNIVDLNQRVITESSYSSLLYANDDDV